jgi:hypothetical protein
MPWPAKWMISNLSLTLASKFSVVAKDALLASDPAGNKGQGLIEAYQKNPQKFKRYAEKRSNGRPDVWAYHWWESNPNGGRTQRKRIIGTKLEYPTKAAARKAVEGLQLDINAESVTKTLLTVNQTIAHYKGTELADLRQQNEANEVCLQAPSRQDHFSKMGNTSVIRCETHRGREMVS